MPDARKPIDAATLTEPVKAVTEGNIFYVLTEADTWGGVWAFPPGWERTAQETWTAIKGRQINEDGLRRAAEEKAARASTSPEALIARARIEADEAQRTREAAERRALGEVAWLKALEEHGPRVRRLGGPTGTTVEGDIIIMIGMTRQEADAANARAKKLREVVLASDPKNDTRATNEWKGAHRDAMLAKVIHPERARIKALGDNYADLWTELELMRDDMVRVRQLDEGKEPAL